MALKAFVIVMVFCLAEVVNVTLFTNFTRAHSDQQ